MSAEAYEDGEHKIRVKQAGARRKLGFFLKEKFGHEAVGRKLAEYGCEPTKTKRVIVTWDCKPGVVDAAKAEGIEVWLLPDLMHEIAILAKSGKTYFSDDTLRTITLFARGVAKA